MQMPEMNAAAQELQVLLMDAMKSPTPWSLDTLGTERIYRRFFETQEHRLRLSFGSVCDRRLWYCEHEPAKGVAADGGARIKFAFGDLVEALVLSSLAGHMEKIKSHWQFDPEWTQPSLFLPIHDEAGTPLKGITGSPDGLLTYKGAPYALIDSKGTTVWSWKKWDQYRVPDPMFGYRHQAANYTFAEDVPDIMGFIWLVSILDNNNIKDYGVGWMTKRELQPYADDAHNRFARAITLTSPPPPCVADRNEPPCRAKTTIYCPFHEHCVKDAR